MRKRRANDENFRIQKQLRCRLWKALNGRPTTRRRERWSTYNNNMLTSLLSDASILKHETEYRQRTALASAMAEIEVSLDPTQRLVRRPTPGTGTWQGRLVGKAVLDSQVAVRPGLPVGRVRLGASGTGARAEDAHGVQMYENASAHV